jgi:hypothetical protein
MMTPLVILIVLYDLPLWLYSLCCMMTPLVILIVLYDLPLWLYLLCCMMTPLVILIVLYGYTRFKQMCMPKPSIKSIQMFWTTD